MELVEGVDGGFGLASGHGFLGNRVRLMSTLAAVWGNAAVFSPVCGHARILKDGEEGGEEGDLDAGDGGEAEQAIFDLGGELGVGGVVGDGGVEGDGGDVAWGEAGDVGAGGIEVGGEGGGADEAGGDDVGCRWGCSSRGGDGGVRRRSWWRSGWSVLLTVSFRAELEATIEDTPEQIV